MSGNIARFIFPIFLFSALFLSAEDTECRAQAELTVEKSGLVEVVLPPELNIGASGGLDLRVVSAEGKPLARELYWKKARRDEFKPLLIQSTKLQDNGRFSWIGKTEKPAKTGLIRVYLSSDDYVARVNVSALVSGSWKLLAGNAAVYRLEGTSRADIDIPDGVYSAFKLDFFTFDAKYLQIPAPVERIEILVTTPGVGYAEAVEISAPLRADDGGRIVLSVTLPGTGFIVDNIQVTTTEPFLGSWTLEQEVIENGKRAYTFWKEGLIDALEKGSNVLVLAVNEIPRSRNIRLILVPEAFPGEVQEWRTLFFLPRLVFKAEAGGKYTVQAGCGDTVSVLEEPSSAGRGSVQSAVWGKMQVNAAWKSEDLLKKYALSGGPFDPKNYAWSAALPVSDGGYYRVVLNTRSALEGNTQALRIVRLGKQVPYFTGQGETVSVALTAVEKYNEKANTSIWEILLPSRSQNWGDLILEAEGVFSRKLIFNGVYETDWRSTGPKEAVLRIPLSPLLQGNEKIRLEIQHGDNRALALTKIEASYYASALCFLAEGGDGYFLYGGNPASREARYDLDLVQDDLLTQEPVTIAMGECLSAGGTAFFSDLGAEFSGSKWGLYAVLALVTLVLLLVIVKLFPRTR